MTIDGERHVVQSYLGSVFTILVFLTTLLYSVQKLDVLIAKKDVNISSAVKGMVFSDDFKFSYRTGFNIAVAFTEYNYNSEWDLDPKYGTLVLNSLSWGTDPDGSPFIRRIQLPTHLCSKEEI